MGKIKEFCSNVKNVAYSVGEIFHFNGVVSSLKKIEAKFDEPSQSIINKNPQNFIENIESIGKIMKSLELNTHFGSCLYATDLTTKETICCAVLVYTSGLIPLSKKIDPKNYMKNICFDPKMYKKNSMQKNFIDKFLIKGEFNINLMKNANRILENNQKPWKFLSAGFLSPSQTLSLIEKGKLIIYAFGTAEYLEVCDKLGINANDHIAIGNDLAFFAENFMENTMFEEEKTLLTNHIDFNGENIIMKQKLSICSEYSEEIQIPKEVWDKKCGRVLKLQYFK